MGLLTIIHGVITMAVSYNRACKRCELMLPKGCKMKKNRTCGECVGMDIGVMPCPHREGRHWGCNVMANTIADGCKMLEPLTVTIKKEQKKEVKE